MNIPDTLIIFGAGSEKALGFPTTNDIENILKALFGFENDGINKLIPLRTRLERALKDYFGEYREGNRAYPIYKNLELTLRIFYDGNGAESFKEAMKDRDTALDEFLKLYKNFIDDKYEVKNKDKLSDNLYNFKRYLDIQSSKYDWINMKALAYFLYRNQPKQFKITDLLGMLYNSQQSGLALIVPEYFGKKDSNSNYKCDANEIFNVYKLILYKIFKGISYIKLSDKDKNIKLYYEFFKKFIVNYNEKIKFVSFNWNPIFEFLAYRANYRLNHSENSNIVRYIDHSALVNFWELDSEKDNIIPAFTGNLKYFSKKLCNNPKNIISVGFYPVHGTFNTRFCPKCSSIFMIYPKKQADLDMPKDLYDLFLIDPFPSKIDLEHYGKYDVLKKKLETGRGFGEIECPFCNTPIGFEDTMLEIQIMFKDHGHFLIKKMLSDFANDFSNAKRIIVLGYSFPDDDIKNLLFLKAFKDVNVDSHSEQKIYVVGYNEKYRDRKSWITLKKSLKNPSDDELLSDLKRNLNKLFSADSVKLSFQGLPEIFLSADGEEVNIDVFK